MTDLSTKYLGIPLKNPLIVGSCRLTGTLDGVKKAAHAGAGAVVLKSIFEEQITSQVQDLVESSASPAWHPEAMDYITRYGQEDAVGKYLELIRQAKASVKIPVLASVHCTTAGGWTDFAKRAQDAGADALELNLFVMPSDPRRDGRTNEAVYFDVLQSVKEKVTVPVALKVGTFFSSLAHSLTELSKAGADGLVLFNRYYSPDFDIEKMKLKPAPFLSRPEDSSLPLRWISIMANRVSSDLAATGGVHDGATLTKMLLAGADAVQVCSTLYLHGVERVTTLLEDLKTWMNDHGHKDVASFRGALSQDTSANPAAYERVQFMKTSVGIE